MKSPPPPAQKETNNSPQSLSEETPDQSPSPRSKQNKVEEEAVSEDLDATIAETDPVSDSEVKSPLPIRLPTKCKPKTDSDSDSDSKSTKSSASSSGRVSKVLKKTFKGKAIAIVKPFSNAVTEKKSSPNEKQKEIESRLNLYEFGSDEERDAAQRSKLEKSDEKDTSEKDSPEVTSDLVSLNNTSSSISSIKGIKRIKSVKQGLLSSRRVRVNPELKTVRVRVEKLQNNSSKSDKLKVRQCLAKNKTSSATKARLKESQSSSEKESSSSCDPSIESNTFNDPDKSQEKVLSESKSSSNANVENRVFRGNEIIAPKCKQELDVKTLTHTNEANERDLDKLGFPPLKSSPECKPTAVKVEPVSSDIPPVPYNSDALLLKNDKIDEIVKEELFSQPSSLSQDSVKPKPEVSVPERNEDSSSVHRNR